MSDSSRLLENKAMARAIAQVLGENKQQLGNLTGEPVVSVKLNSCEVVVETLGRRHHFYVNGKMLGVGEKAALERRRRQGMF